ncbi:uncharacterized protein LOC105195057 [Solenopsis invicta]|uniref:uncharacterized protein LOC105195057 n=1 Tax=Solenopsis invicta TaxID=13686 RepID=UPI000595F03B|nr:uncharacterized protein LOC105195057 [Solenopsis invicta]
MAAKTISDEKEVENIVSLPQKKQSSLCISSSSKGYCQTSIEMITYDYTWTINNFTHFCDMMEILISPPFPKSGDKRNQYAIKMGLPLAFPGSSREDITYNIELYLITKEPFNGSCTTTISYPAHEVVSSKSIVGYIGNLKMLNEYSFKPRPYSDSLVIRCEIKIVNPKHDISKDICADSSLNLSEDTGFN